MARQSTPFTKKGIEKLPNDKPALYRIKTESGNDNYVGIAQRGRLQDRLREHLPAGQDPVPGARVEVELMSRIQDARAKEQNVIRRSQPKHNKQGK